MGNLKVEGKEGGAEGVTHQFLEKAVPVEDPV